MQGGFDGGQGLGVPGEGVVEIGRIGDRFAAEFGRHEDAVGEGQRQAAAVGQDAVGDIHRQGAGIGDKAIPGIHERVGLDPLGCLEPGTPNQADRDAIELPYLGLVPPSTMGPGHLKVLTGPLLSGTGDQTIGQWFEALQEELAEAVAITIGEGPFADDVVAHHCPFPGGAQGGEGADAHGVPQVPQGRQSGAGVKAAHGMADEVHFPDPVLAVQIQQELGQPLARQIDVAGGVHRHRGRQGRRTVRKGHQGIGARVFPDGPAIIHGGRGEDPMALQQKKSAQFGIRVAGGKTDAAGPPRGGEGTDRVPPRDNHDRPRARWGRGWSWGLRRPNPRLGCPSPGAGRQGQGEAAPQGRDGKHGLDAGLD